MTLNFPNAPTNGQIFGGYQYNTAKGVWARANFSAIEASTTNLGIVQLATAAETLTGTATSRAVTPVGLEPLRSRLTATVADFTALAALSTTNKLEGDLAFVVEGAVYMSRVGSAWVQVTVATFATSAARDTAYAKAGAVFRTTGAQCRVAASRAPHSIQQFHPANGNTFWRHLMGDVPLLVPLIAGNGTIQNNLGGPVQFANSTTMTLRDIFAQEFQSYRVEIDFTGNGDQDMFFRFGNAGVANANNVYFWVEQNTSAAATSVISNNSSSFIVVGRISPTGSFLEATIQNPAGTAQTRVLSRSHDAQNFQRVNGGAMSAGVNTDLFIGGTSGGAFSGVIRVYGRAS